MNRTVEYLILLYGIQFICLQRGEELYFPLWIDANSFYICFYNCWICSCVSPVIWMIKEVE